MKKFVQESPYNVGLDSAILMNPQVWVASGHVVNFNDPLIDCKSCKMRHRADKLVEEFNQEHGNTRSRVKPCPTRNSLPILQSIRSPVPAAANPILPLSANSI